MLASIIYSLKQISRSLVRILENLDHFKDHGENCQCSFLVIAIQLSSLKEPLMLGDPEIGRPTSNGLTEKSLAFSISYKF